MILLICGIKLKNKNKLRYRKQIGGCNREEEGVGEKGKLFFVF